MIIEINKNIDNYKESVVMGRASHQRISVYMMQMEIKFP